MKVAVIGATGQTGPHAVRALRAAGLDAVAVARDAGKLAPLADGGPTAVADVTDRAALTKALADAECVVTLAPHSLLEDVLKALPDSCRRLIIASSVRKYSRLPDPVAESARRVDGLFAASGRDGLVLNFSMIYGQPEDSTVNRVMAMVRHRSRLNPLPLPDGGRHLVQPIHIDDMTASVTAAVTGSESGGESIDVAGPEPIRYADMVRLCAAAMGRRVSILPLPAGLLIGTARLADRLGIRLPVSADEIARLCEDKSFDISAMRTRLGVDPVSFAEGLRRSIARGWLD